MRRWLNGFRLPEILVILAIFMVTSCAAQKPPPGFETEGVKEARDLVIAAKYFDAMRIQATNLRKANILKVQDYVKYLQLDNEATKSWNAYIELVRAGKGETPDAQAKLTATLAFVTALEGIILKVTEIILTPTGKALSRPAVMTGG